MSSKEKIVRLRAENQLLGSVVKELKNRVSDLEARAAKSKNAATASRVHEEALRELRSLLEDSRNECGRLRAEKAELADAALDLSDELQQAKQRIGRAQEEVSSLQARARQVAALEETVAQLMDANASLVDQNASLAAERDNSRCEHSGGSAISTSSGLLSSNSTGEDAGVARLEMLSRATLSPFHAPNLSSTSSSSAGKDSGDHAGTWADRGPGSSRGCGPSPSPTADCTGCQACASLRAHMEESERGMQRRLDVLLADKATLERQVARLQVQHQQAQASLEESHQVATKLRAEADWLYHHAQRLRGEQQEQLARGEELLARLASATAQNRALVEQSEACGRQLAVAQGEIRELRDTITRGRRHALQQLAAPAHFPACPVSGTALRPGRDAALLLADGVEEGSDAGGGSSAAVVVGALSLDARTPLCCCAAYEELRALKVYARVMEVDLASEREAAEEHRRAQREAQDARHDVQQQLDAALKQCTAGMQALELEFRHVSALEKLRGADLQEILDLEKHNRAIQQENWYLREVVVKQKKQLVICQCEAS
eukprot:jgi/Mesvir1/24924/Mv16904-RA.1